MRVFFLLITLAAWPVFAAPVRTPQAEAELVAERDALVPGEPITVALRLAAIPGWHTYWRNPGDSGEPTRIEWRLPPGFTAGEIDWSVPQRISVGPLMNYGYDTRWASPETTKQAKNHVRAALGEAMAGKPVSVSATSPYGCTVKY